MKGKTEARTRPGDAAAAALAAEGDDRRRRFSALYRQAWEVRAESRALVARAVESRTVRLRNRPQAE